MITPAYCLTSTERVLPKLALDFTTGELDNRVTFTRATSASNPATYTNASGVIVDATNNEPRFDYESGVCKGLLIEESRTNLLLNSVFDGAVAGTPGTAPTSWGFVQSGNSYINDVAQGSYENGQYIYLKSTNSRIYFTQTIALSANTTYIFSSNIHLYGNTVRCNYMFGGPVPTGTTLTYYVDGVAQASNYYVPLGAHKFTVVITTSSTAGNFGLRFGLGTPDVQSGNMIMQNPQLEVGAFATSYIPTTTTALTRNADVATMTGTNFSDWFNATEGSFMSIVNSYSRLANGTTVSLDSGNTNLIRQGFTSGEGRLVVRTSGTTVVSIGSEVYSGSGPYQMCSSYKADDFSHASNGSNFVTDTGGALPAIGQLKIGAYGSSGPALNGHIAKIMYWPIKLTDNEIQTFSKG